MNRAKSLQIFKNGMYTCYNVALRTEYKPAILNTNINTVSTDFVRKFSQIMNRAKSSQILTEENVCMHVHDSMLVAGIKEGDL